MKADKSKDIHHIFAKEGHLIDEALNEGVRQALLQHAKLGESVVIERNGKIEWVPAEELLNEPPTKVAERPDAKYGEDT